MKIPRTSSARFPEAGPPGSWGFSLVEVLCAVVILGVALVGLTQGISTALQSNKDSELQTTAAIFAAGLIETVRAEGWITDETTEGTCGPGLSQYEWTQTIAPTEINGLHEVTVLVSHATTQKTICELKTLLFEVPYDSTSTSASRREQDRRSSEGNRRNRQ